jgi:hypothetical protein
MFLLLGFYILDFYDATVAIELLRMKRETGTAGRPLAARIRKCRKGDDMSAHDNR